MSNFLVFKSEFLTLFAVESQLRRKSRLRFFGQKSYNTSYPLAIMFAILDLKAGKHESLCFPFSTAAHFAV